jgi:hypothetical protein
MGAVFYVTGRPIRSPYGSWPGYLKFQEKDFDRAGEKVWGAGFKYDFGAGTLLPGVREVDFDVTWNIPWVKGLQFRFRNAYVAQSGERVLKAFRIILNYEFPLL